MNHTGIWPILIVLIGLLSLVMLIVSWNVDYLRWGFRRDFLSIPLALLAGLSMKKQLNLRQDIWTIVAAAIALPVTFYLGWHSERGDRRGREEARLWTVGFAAMYVFWLSLSRSSAIQDHALWILCIGVNVYLGWLRHNP